MRRTLEVPVDSIAAAEMAAPFADRLEVCSDLASEGWSPDAWLVREIRARTPARVVAMIRPRTPDAIAALGPEAFRCTPSLLDACLREIEALARAGAHDVAVGPIDGAHGVDLHACSRMIEVARARGLGVSFLRTFDLLHDRDAAMRDLIALGFDRLLTCGAPGWNAAAHPLQARTAELARLVALGAAEAARLGRPAPEVMPCGGVRAANADAWLAVTPHLHASCRVHGALCREEAQALRARLGVSPRP
jgi:copper homeostasis protein CutC